MNSLNFRTQTKKVWDKLKKVNRNYKSRIILLLKRRGNTITSPDEIADTFPDHYANISKYKKGKKEKDNHIKNHSQTEN